VTVGVALFIIATRAQFSAHSQLARLAAQRRGLTAVTLSSREVTVGSSESRTQSAGHIVGLSERAVLANNDTHCDATNTVSDSANKVTSSQVNSCGYSIPTGDWFEFSSSPHYLAEMLIYTALFLITFTPTTTFFAAPASVATSGAEYCFHGGLVSHAAGLLSVSYALAYRTLTAAGASLVAVLISVLNAATASTFRATGRVHTKTLNGLLTVAVSLWAAAVRAPMLLCLVWVLSNVGILARETHAWYLRVFGKDYPVKRAPLVPKWKLKALFCCAKRT